MDNAMRCPPLAHRSAAAHKLHSAQATILQIRESENHLSGTNLSLCHPGGCPNYRDHRNTTAITQAEADLKTAQTAKAGIETERALAHGLVGALTAGIGGTSPVSGFIGGTAGKLATTELDKLLADSTWAQTNPTAANLLKTLTATTVGSITGGTTGGFVASQGDRFNRQLHESEKRLIKVRAKGDAARQERLEAMACALVRCWGEYPEGSAEYQAAFAQAAAGQRYLNDVLYAEDARWLNLEHAKGQFRLTEYDQFKDFTKQWAASNPGKSFTVDLLPGAGSIKSILQDDPWYLVALGIVPGGKGVFKVVTKGDELAGAVKQADNLPRPTPKQSEVDVGHGLGAGWRPQVSYKDGKEVSYGTAGSVRPDWCNTTTCSVEVKNYNIATNSSGLVNNVVQQAIERQANLPAGMRQEIVIDIRGQVVNQAQRDFIKSSIADKSGGIISSLQIKFRD